MIIATTINNILIILDKITTELMLSLTFEVTSLTGILQSLAITLARPSRVSTLAWVATQPELTGGVTPVTVILIGLCVVVDPLRIFGRSYTTNICINAF